MFGDQEMIFGYKGLRVNLYYTAGSLKQYVKMNHTEIVSNRCSEKMINFIKALTPPCPVSDSLTQVKPTIPDSIMNGYYMIKPSLTLKIITARDPRFTKIINQYIVHPRPAYAITSYKCIII